VPYNQKKLPSTFVNSPKKVKIVAPDTNLTAYLNELRKNTRGDLRTDEYSRVLYSTDASIYQVMPLGVFFPLNAEEVHAAVELAAAFRVPLLPRTAGSSLAGQAVNEALVLEMSRHMDKIMEVNQEEHWVRVQPGIVLDELDLQMKAYGLQFGPDPASSNRAAMGGIVANNSTGAHSILHGMTADHVLATSVILSDGSRTTFQAVENASQYIHKGSTSLESRIYEGVLGIAQDHAETILAGTPRHWRRCGGYNLDRFIDGPTFKVPQDPRFNLARLISGSEGTLAVMTEIKLNLVPRPRQTALAILHFEDLKTALEAVPTILEIEPSAVELMDNLGLTMCREVPEYARLLSTFVDGTPNCILITEFYGDEAAALEGKIEELRSHLQRAKIPATIVPAIPAEVQNNVWTVRKVGLGLLMSIKGDHKPIPFIEDAAVPAEHLADYVARIEEFCNSIGTNVAYYAHASAGCIHIRPLINTKVASEVEKLSKIGQFAAELLGGFGGSLSSEHGDGRARSWLNEYFYGKPLYALYKQVKNVFDPDNILNPGNIVEGGPVGENLRFGGDYEVIPLREHLDFSTDLGFHRAIEMCNGAGICRKHTTGTMCPSFMVTREEEHSTRGRANALRAAISGLLPPAELTSPRMYQVMDLCIECKACKAECPSSVDMAKIKFEFLAHYYDANGIPLRARLFGEIARLSRIASGPLAPLANWGLKTGAVRWGLEKTLGISRKRVMPEFAGEPFDVWFKRNGRRNNIKNSANSRQVVLFNDTFNTFNEPEVARAATELLEAACFTVHLPGHRCCGRPMISKGLVAAARRAARETIGRLAPFAEQGIPIVGLEPSCVLSFRDEYLSLLPDDPKARLVAKYSFTFEEFIDNLASQEELDLRFTREGRNLLLHGHCHQKALVGTGPSERVLSLPENYKVEVVDSGCCGMAGAFGYEADHYDLSMAMGERRLLPAARSASGDTILVAPGFSCRHQIADGAGRKALHPAQVLRAALI
jgi:FAD/FMN-containing dehydrogenase/Fe-S oxidoreductase